MNSGIIFIILIAVLLIGSYLSKQIKGNRQKDYISDLKEGYRARNIIDRYLDEDIKLTAKDDTLYDEEIHINLLSKMESDYFNEYEIKKEYMKNEDIFFMRYAFLYVEKIMEKEMDKYFETIKYESKSDPIKVIDKTIYNEDGTAETIWKDSRFRYKERTVENTEIGTVILKLRYSAIKCLKYENHYKVEEIKDWIIQGKTTYKEYRL